jgi:AmiR/NasT family two-component response regulator
MGPRLRILIAHDDYGTRELLQDLLGGQGHDVGSVAGLSLLPALCRDLGPDVVFAPAQKAAPDIAALAACINQQPCTAFVLIADSAVIPGPVPHAVDGIICCLCRPLQEADVAQALQHAVLWLERSRALPKGA